MLIVHVCRGTGIYRLILNDLGILQVPLNVQSLEKLENVQIFRLSLYLWLMSTEEVRFYNFQG